MNSENQTISTPPPAPNTRERPSNQGAQTVFFDRRPDAALLADKVLAARFTVFYAPLGVGKSFVLQNLLVSDLEKQKACVIYFQDWQSDDPAATLKAQLVAEAAKLQIPEPGAGRPSLVDLTRLLLIPEDRPVVLILDQFEEFLAAPQDRWESLRRELGMLARTPDLNVRVLLSIQEQEQGKHFDALEKLQAIIPNLLQSTYRLAPAPYVGLRPFMRGEEAIFSGRNQDAVILRDKVLSSRITVLYGPTGVGKSSILHLLLAPLLEKEGARVIFFDKWLGPKPTALLKNHLARVFYFDRWPGPKPMALPQDHVAGAAFLTITQSKTKPEPRSLTYCVRLLQKAENQEPKKRTVVLILDQFEEFFLDSSSDRLNTLREELGQLVNTTDLDVRVLLSLREEHLASLEPLRTTILNLFQSTHRLGPLTIAEARGAIVGPAKLFGAKYEQELIDLLLSNLSQTPPGRLDQSTQEIDAAAPADLPLLQLICDELWKETIAREVRKISTGPESITILGPITISKELYQRDLGGLKGILDRFLGRVMGHKVITAHLMEFLAPSSGYKQAYDAEFLAKRLKLPLTAVESELMRLSKTEVNVVRSRKYGAGSMLYELCHDKFISIIAPWRDEILRRAQFWLWIKRAAFVMAFIFLVVLGKDLYDLHKNTIGIMKTKQELKDKLDHTTGYLLKFRSDSRFERLSNYLFELGAQFDWGNDSTRFDILKGFLKNNVGSGYGLVSERRSTEGTADPEADFEFDYKADFPETIKIENWPLVVQYPLGQDLDENEFNQVWKRQAIYLTKKLGIPVPLKLKLIKEIQEKAHRTTESKEQTGLKKNQVNFSHMENEVLTRKNEVFTFAEMAGDFCIDIGPKRILGPSKHFFKKFKDEWKEIRAAEDKVQYYSVPRWSLPVWQHSGIFTTDVNGITALFLAKELQTRPDLILTRDSVLILLRKLVERQRTTVGQTVVEALDVRRDRLTEDFRAIVKIDPELTWLPVWLDILANYPKSELTTADRVEAKLSAEIKTPASFLPDKLRGPNSAFDPGEIHEAYSGVERLVNVKRSPPSFRLYLGKGLAKRLRPEDGSESELSEQVEKILDRLARQFGVDLPKRAIRIDTRASDPEMPDNAFRIEIFNQDIKDAKKLDADQAEPLKQVSAALAFSIQSFRSHFVTADSVFKELRSMPPRLRQWILARYSLTDLKLLLQGVINPTPNEVKNWEHALGAGVPDKNFNVSPESSIRQQSWLLASLVFWAQVPKHDLRSRPAMVQDLLSTQSARVSRKPGPLKITKISKTVEEGIKAIKDSPFTASATFARAIHADQQAAIASFLALYPQELRRSLINKFAKFADSSNNLENIYLRRADWIELEDLVAEGDLDQQEGVQTARSLRLVNLANYRRNLAARRQIAADIAKRYDKPEQWQPQQAAWFGKELLVLSEGQPPDNFLALKGIDFLKSSLPRLSDPDSIKTYVEYLREGLAKPGPNQWCLELLLIMATKADPATELNIALSMSARDVPSDVWWGRSLVDEARKKLASPEIDKDERASLLEWADYSDAASLLQLTELEQGVDTAEAEKTLLRLKDSNNLDLGYLAHKDLSGLMRRRNRLKEADALLDEALQKWPEGEKTINLYSQKLAVKLLDEDQEGVVKISSEARQKVKYRQEKVTEDTQDFAFLAALGLLITKSDGEKVTRDFLKTKQGNVPYIAMMLYWRLAGKNKAEAQAVISDQWDRIKPNSETWKGRLERGDLTVWGEKLIGFYYQGKVPEELFAELEDKALFANSDLRHLPKQRQSFICEAYFYDALLADSNGDKARSTASLKKALATGQSSYFEYCMAKFLLAQQSERK